MGTDSQRRNVSLQMPPSAKKLVQNLKEVINKNCTDTEVYAVLLDCNMDPDDAIQRLLSQDTFREVKSKREKRKGMKETQDSKSRCNNCSSNRDVKYNIEPTAPRLGSTEKNCREYGKGGYRRENGSATPSVSSSSYVYRATGKIINEQPSRSESSNADNRRKPVQTGDTLHLSWKSSAGPDSAWQGITKGHVSMADIVRGGRAQNKDYQALRETSYMADHEGPPDIPGYNTNSSQTFSFSESQTNQDLCSSHPSNASEMIHNGKHDLDHQWPAFEHLTAVGGSVIDPYATLDAEMYLNPSFLCSERANLLRSSQSDVLPVSENDAKTRLVNGSASGSSSQIFANAAGGASNNEITKETISYSHEPMSKHHKDIPFQTQSGSLNDATTEAVSSAVANLDQLSIGKERAPSLSENNSSVVLPNYLQAFSADCSHLSFGTYKSKGGSASNSWKGELLSEAGERSSAAPLNIRNLGHGNIQQLGSEYSTLRAAEDAQNHGLSVFPQPVLRKQAFPEATYEHRYTSSAMQDSGSMSKLSFAINPNARNLPPLVNEHSHSHSHSQSIPSDLFASAAQTLRYKDSSLLSTRQSMPSRYGNAVSSMNGPVSMSEVLYSGNFCLPQQSHALPVSNIAKESLPSQHLSFDSYSASSLSLGGLDSMNRHPSMHRNQPYVSSALPQAYQDQTVFNNSLEDMMYNVPQYRHGATMSNLPRSNINASNNGLFNGVSNMPRSFLHNLSDSTGNRVGYDLLQSQYKDGNNFNAFEQNNTSMWGIGTGSQAAASTYLVDDAYYQHGLLGQNPLHGRYRE